MGSVQRIRFLLSIPPDDYLTYYRGEVRFVVAKAFDGRTVKFPASALRRFITREGITGEFEIELGPGNHMKSFRRIR